MNKQHMTSLQRVLAALGHKEAGRVPFCLMLTMHGAKELGLTIKDYFSKAENVVEGQLRLRRKYRHDNILPFFYSAVEVEVWGGDVIYSDDGPPNSGEPIINNFTQINKLKVPDISTNRVLQKGLRAIRLLKEKVGEDAPIFGCVTSPFSLPVMQMGFDKYLDLMTCNTELFWKLMQINEEFCVNWANAQLEAGATAIAYADPVSSTTIISREMYLKTGFIIASRVIPRIKAGVATNFASGRCLPIIDDVIKTGTVLINASALENLAEVKAACAGRTAVMGNLNAITMRKWTPSQAESEVKKAIAAAARGGGYILSDNHGEIPFQVPEDVLLTISEAVHEWGQYPLQWIESES